MNGYKVRYRGGPYAGRIEMVSHKPPVETQPLKHIPKPSKRKRMNFYDPYDNLWSVRASMPKEKYGVYSQVYSRLKDGSILYVWVER